MSGTIMSEEERAFRQSKGFQDALKDGLAAINAAVAQATAARQPYDLELRANRLEP